MQEYFLHIKDNSYSDQNTQMQSLDNVVQLNMPLGFFFYSYQGFV